MKIWKSEANQKILDIDYYDLVMNTENTAKKIWDFCREVIK